MFVPLVQASKGLAELRGIGLGVFQTLGAPNMGSPVVAGPPIHQKTRIPEHIETVAKTTGAARRENIGGRPAHAHITNVLFCKGVGVGGMVCGGVGVDGRLHGWSNAGQTPSHEEAAGKTEGSRVRCRTPCQPAPSASLRA